MFANFLLATVTATSQPHVTASKTATAPTVDGKLDDAVWSQAPAADGFTQKIPAGGEAPSEPTTVRVLYDDDAVYVGIDCVQRHSPIALRLTRRDRNVESDWVSVNLDTRGDGKSALEFLVNASGVLVDGARSNDVDYSADWDENWEAKSWVGEGHWSVEIKIPLRILRFSRASVQSWGLELRRYISAKQETDEWAYIPRTVAAEVSRYGKLDGLRGLLPKSPLELRPSALLRLRSRDATVDTTGSGVDLLPSASLDLKWHPSQDLTLDATFNPDFAQVEADQVVLNLSTFEVYKPEKRPFFLEGSDLIAPKLGLQLVYTKRIGRAPDLPQLRTDAPFGEKLVDLPEPSTIYGATKLTGRLSEKVSVGTLSALVGRNQADVQLQTGEKQARLLEPLTAYNVLRLKRDLGANAHVGLLATATTRAEDAGAYAGSPSDASSVLCPNQVRADGSYAPMTVARGRRCFHDAYVLGVDARLRSGDWVTSGQLAMSMMQRGPVRVQDDGTRLGQGDVGPGADFYFGREGGKHLTTWTWFGNAGKKLDYNDLGFMWRANVRYAGGGMEFRTLEPWWKTLETHTGFEVAGFDNLDGLNLSREGGAWTEWKFSSFWTVRVGAGVRSQHFDDREVGDGTALERDLSSWVKGKVSTDPRGRVSVVATGQYTSVRTGHAANADATVTMRVLPQLDVELTPQFSLASGEQRYATDSDDGTTHLYGPLDANNVSLTMRAIYTFLPRLSLQAYAQAFLANGHYTGLYAPVSGASGVGHTVLLSDLAPFVQPVSSNPDFQQGAVNVNASLRWEYKTGSTVSLVYARSQYPKVPLGFGEPGTLDTRAIGRAPAVDALFLKVSYFWG